jgi:hypothetical protein
LAGKAVGRCGGRQKPFVHNQVLRKHCATTPFKPKPFFQNLDKDSGVLGGAARNCKLYRYSVFPLTKNTKNKKIKNLLLKKLKKKNKNVSRWFEWGGWLKIKKIINIRVIEVLKKHIIKKNEY